MRRELPLLLLLACGTIPSGTPPEAPTELAVAPPIRRAIDRTLHGDTRWNREERLLWEMGCEELERFTSGRARFVIVWDLSGDAVELLADDAPRVVRVPGYIAPIPWADAHAGGGAQVLAWTEPGPIIHVVAERCAELYPVILHELGHAAGLDDLPEGYRGVMNLERRAWKFSEDDRRECVRVARCEAR